MDEFLKTLITQMPNFLGLIAALYVVTKFMVSPLLEENKRLTDALMAMVQKCMEEHKNSGAVGLSQTEPK